MHGKRKAPKQPRQINHRDLSRITSTHQESRIWINILLIHCKNHSRPDSFHALWLHFVGLKVKFSIATKLSFPIGCPRSSYCFFYLNTDASILQTTSKSNTKVVNFYILAEMLFCLMIWNFSKCSKKKKSVLNYKIVVQ